jgi:hypothetical protein
MGLKVSSSELDPANQTDVQVIDSVMPFSFSSEMRADIAVNLDWRHGNGPWQPVASDAALDEIHFSSLSLSGADSSKGRADEAHHAAVARNPVSAVDVDRAIGYLCEMEKALDTWATDNPAKLPGDDPYDPAKIVPTVP